MTLRTSADNAEDAAAGFRMFREPLPEHATEITGLIAELYAISTSLKSLEDLTNNRLYRHNLPLAQADLELVCTSLKYTLEDIVDFFGDIEVWRGPQREIYRRTWTQLSNFFRKEAQYSLAIRLGKYKAFLKELEDLMKDTFPDTTLMAGLRSSIKALLIEQGNRPVSPPPRLNTITFPGHRTSSGNAAEPESPAGERKPRNRRSYERTRPQRLPPPASPSSATFSDVPPSAPDAPDSLTDSSQFEDSYGLEDHWAREVFSDDLSATRIPFVGESSKCLGEPIPGVKQWLQDGGFEELFQLAFTGNTELRVSFYVREDDHRARIVCKVPRSTRSSDYFCLPLNLLEIVRVGSCLQVCRRRNGGTELVLWANLKFNTIERMVLFYCTFLALRSQDSGRPVDNIRDYELDQEEELFGGQIDDDRYLHALRVYRDTASGAVRLQASVHRGEMKRAPVWTAFITHHIKSRTWMRRADAKVVLLRDLRRTVFTFSDYTPPRTQRGEHILNFTSRSDADSFIETITELASMR